jgi:antitoxin ParD1/3/4
MQIRTVKLTDRLNAYIEEAVASGRYVDASEVIREGLRLLALREWEDGTAPASAPRPAGATLARHAA